MGKKKPQRHSSMMGKNRESDAIGDQQEMEATTEGNTALPPSFLTRNDSSSFSVKLAVWARSHRSITRGSSNSAREQGVVCLGRSQGRTHPGAGAHVVCQPEGIVYVLHLGSTKYLVCAHSTSLGVISLPQVKGSHLRDSESPATPGQYHQHVPGCLWLRVRENRSVIGS